MLQRLIVLIAGAVLLLAALLHGGIYVVSSAGGIAYVLNRYTGSVVACDFRREPYCWPVPPAPVRRAP